MTRLRLATAADFDAIAAITNHYIRNTTIHFGCEPVTADAMRTEWRAADQHPWLGAVGADDTLLGFAKAGVFRARAAYRWTTETGIYLAPEHCGRGTGALLYGRLLAVLRAQGFHSAIGGIALPNQPSVQLHERLGFRPSGVILRAGRKFDRWHDLGFWQLLLQGEEHAPGPLLPPAAAFSASEPD